jgi:hypothetical protein
MKSKPCESQSFDDSKQKPATWNKII